MVSFASSQNLLLIDGDTIVQITPPQLRTANILIVEGRQCKLESEHLMKRLFTSDSLAEISESLIRVTGRMVENQADQMIHMHNIDSIQNHQIGELQGIVGKMKRRRRIVRWFIPGGIASGMLLSYLLVK